MCDFEFFFFFLLLEMMMSVAQNYLRLASISHGKLLVTQAK